MSPHTKPSASTPPARAANPDSSLFIGLSAGFVAALIAASWQVATRYGVTTSLPPSDLALLRYGIPALLLCPLLFKHGFVPAGAHRGWFALMICGGGIGYGALAMTGARFSPTAHMGVLLSGTMPLFTAALFFLFTGENISTRRMIGYTLILIGALAFGFSSERVSIDDVWIGDLFFLAASLAWALYTLAFRKLSLSPWYSAALVSFWSSLAAIVWASIVGNTMLVTAPRGEVWFQAALQGLVAGLLGSYVYVVSIRHLGASNAAIFATFVPLLSALGGYLVLSETISLSTAITIVIVVAGIVLARQRSDAVFFNRSSEPTPSSRSH
jgi:drug/metabolite transporter (DMT)-like permease